jgi:hypothetical protein
VVAVQRHQDRRRTPSRLPQPNRPAAGHRHPRREVRSAGRPRHTPTPNRKTGPQPGEIPDAFSWGIARASTFDQARTLRELGNHNHDHDHDHDTTGEVATSLTDRQAATADATIENDTFWTARTELTHIRTYAQAQMASPWAVLAVAMARVVCQMPPRIVLPAIIYGQRPTARGVAPAKPNVPERRGVCCLAPSSRPGPRQ